MPAACIQSQYAIGVLRTGIMRILVAGFPHSGTSILRKLLGNHPDVHDHYVGETARYARDDRLLRRLLPLGYHGKRHVVFKWPFHDVEQRTNAHRIVYIVRNPLDVFGSLQQRFGADLPRDHAPQAWQRYAQFLLGEHDAATRRILRYEDLFTGHYQALRLLLDWLGLDWNDAVTRTEARYAPTRYKGGLPGQAPDRRDHAAFRAWQTAQAFRDMSGQSRRHLDARLADMLHAMPELALLGYAAQAR